MDKDSEKYIYIYYYEIILISIINMFYIILDIKNKIIFYLNIYIYIKNNSVYFFLIVE